MYRLAHPGILATAFVSLAPSPAAIAGGGDDPSTATRVASLPFVDVGNPPDLTDRFDVMCAFEGSTSPHAWYQYTANKQTVFELHLCESFHDTKAYVLDADFNTIRCNDNACSGEFRSQLSTPEFQAGTHFIVVDGWNGERGPYDLAIEAALQLECV